MDITFQGKTDLGKTRTNNEDSFVAKYIWDKKHVLAVAIDGVGGYEGGEVAAATAQQVVAEYLEKYPNGERLSLLKQAVAEANNKIVEERIKQPRYSSMSCVLTACLIELEKKQINMVHVGDSRLYEYHRGKLKKLSHDHSLVGYREEIGDITEDEAMNHPQRNIIGRDVGSAPHKADDNDFLEAKTFPLRPNSILLLCSDGLSDMLKSLEIVSVLERELSLVEKAGALIDFANEKGGKDNITVVLVEYQDDELAEENSGNKPIDIPVHIDTAPPDKIQTNIGKKSTWNTVSKTTIIPFALLLGGLAGWFIHDYFPSSEPVSTHDSLRLNPPDTIEITSKDSLQIKISGTALRADTIRQEKTGTLKKDSTTNEAKKHL
ncbi:MAG: serine/threonine protein phosphatase [Bacteroidetes bacterium]|nr:serine/threonine protein phosphatase [Bacteroidota bacterium]